ncbi:uncharacterized protein [Dermacentor albipictus]|uniref:uncharacterized protein isoform X2 n=1 Tax=Dermacentor albipictus TaxID=60249 RepID=UPI0038FCD242
MCFSVAHVVLMLIWEDTFQTEWSITKKGDDDRAGGYMIACKKIAARMHYLGAHQWSSREERSQKQLPSSIHRQPLVKKKVKMIMDRVLIRTMKKAGTFSGDDDRPGGYMIACKKIAARMQYLGAHQWSSSNDW